MFEALKAYNPDHEREQFAKEEMLSFLAANENQFDRQNLQRHFTGSGLLLSTDLKRVLLNYHKFLDKWLCFGGHADGSRDLFDVAQRETIEESGIEDIHPVMGEMIFDIDIHEIPQNETKKEPPHEHYDVLYLFKTGISEEPMISDESVELRWCALDEAKELSKGDGRMLRILDKWAKLF